MQPTKTTLSKSNSPAGALKATAKWQTSQAEAKKRPLIKPVQLQAGIQKLAREDSKITATDTWYLTYKINFMLGVQSFLKRRE